MPLDSRKSTHIFTVTNRSYNSRQKTVVFVYLTSGSYTYIPISVVMRPHNIIDPEIPDIAGGPPKIPADMVMVAPIGTNFTGVVMVADTTTATASGVAAAKKYQIIEALTVGMVPTGTHIRALLRRLR
jgi:hypothetical protein